MNADVFYDVWANRKVESDAFDATAIADLFRSGMSFMEDSTALKEWVAAIFAPMFLELGGFRLFGRRSQAHGHRASGNVGGTTL